MIRKKKKKKKKKKEGRKKKKKKKKKTPTKQNSLMSCFYGLTLLLRKSIWGPWDT